MECKNKHQTAVYDETDRENTIFEGRLTILYLAQFFNIEVMNPTFFLVTRSATADPWLCKRNNKAGVHVNSLSMQRQSKE